MKITMLKDYDWQVPGKRQWVAFKAGWSGRVTRAQGRDIIAAGAGYATEKPVESPRKGRNRSNPT